MDLFFQTLYRSASPILGPILRCVYELLNNIAPLHPQSPAAKDTELFRRPSVPLRRGSAVLAGGGFYCRLRL